MKKILFNTEATYMATGYSRYGYELIRRIHDSGRFEVAELASYGVSKEEALKQGDERPSKIPWKYYPVVPNGEDQDGQKEFHSNPFNQFGKWRWEHTCLDFKPDICCAWRDNWYDNYMVYSPFRDFYNLIWMPTCDSYPQRAEWISDCSQLNACLAYTKWGQKTLQKQSNDKINLIGIAPPCADYKTFTQIYNKRELKASVGLNPQSVIIGTTMRNQKRKLYPNLFRAFAEFLKGPKQLTEEVYLYCHTYWPDIGWDMPTLLKDLGISRRVLFTYVCKDISCNAVFQSLFNDLRCVCQKCGKNSATLPNSNQGVSVKDLVVIYNLFDIYVQYSNCEGFGIPIIEAAACGVPTMVVDYSGMEDFKDTINSIPIKYSSLEMESETGTYKAVPDDKDFIEKLTTLIKMPDMVRRNLGYKNKLLAMNNYNWDKTAKVWMDYFDSVEVSNRWSSPSRLHTPNFNFPEGLSNDNFVKLTLSNILGKPEYIKTYLYFKYLRNLNWEHSISNYGGTHIEDSLFGERPNFKPYNRQDLINELTAMLEFNNKWEQERVRRLS